MSLVVQMSRKASKNNDLGSDKLIALDVSEGHSYVVWYAHGVCQSEFQVLHTQSGSAKLTELVLRANHPTVYFEATGVYSRPVERFCLDNHLPYCRLNPIGFKIEDQWSSATKD